MDIEQIMGYLPHRYPFLLVDRVGELEDGDRLSGFKNVTINEPFFNGHFPGKPIMPGVLILEAMAQLSGILGFLANGERPDPDVIHYFASADKVRFRRPVVPGDQLRMESRLLAAKQGMRKFQCQAWVGEEPACSAQITTVAGQPG